jgi:thiosulfate reductase cytochrome b subunit
MVSFDEPVMSRNTNVVYRYQNLHTLVALFIVAITFSRVAILTIIDSAEVGCHVFAIQLRFVTASKLITCIQYHCTVQWIVSVKLLVFVFIELVLKHEQWLQQRTPQDLH